MSSNTDWHRTGRRTGIQLAYPFEEKRLLRWTPPFLVQPKLDGERCRVVIDSEGTVQLLSSEANIIRSVPHIQGVFEALVKRGLRSVELDGELYAHGLPLETIHSIVSRKNELHPEFDAIQFHCFDLIDESAIQLDRMHRLLDIFSTIGDTQYELSLVPFKLLDNRDQVLTEIDWSLSQGFEGIVVRALDAQYVRRRSTMMMKFKPKREDIYEIVGFEEGKGKYQNMLGAFICRAQEGEETFHVGSGPSDDQRAYFWSVRATLPGQRVRVRYQHMTNARGVPRSAVFAEIVITPCDTSIKIA